MAHADDVLVLSTRKMFRDIVILLVIGYGLYQTADHYKLMEPLPNAGKTATGQMGGQQQQAPPTDPAGEIIALLETDSDRLIAMVEGQEITLGTVDLAAYNTFTRTGSQVQPGLKASAMRDQLRVGEFFDILSQAVVEKASIARNIVPADAEVDAEVARIKEGFPSEAKFYEQLKAMGTDEDGMRALTSRNLRDEELRRQVLADLQIPASSPDAQGKFQEWIMLGVRELDVEIVDKAFSESLAQFVSMMGAAPEHGGVAGANPHAEVPGAPGGPPADASAKENGPMDTERS